MRARRRSRRYTRTERSQRVLYQSEKIEPDECVRARIKYPRGMHSACRVVYWPRNLRSLFLFNR